MSLLLANRAKADIVDKQLVSPLHMAASSAHPVAHKVLAQLLDAGANVKARDNRRRSVAHYAAAADSLEVLKAVQNVDAQQITSPDADGATPLHHACSSGALSTIDWLLGEGVNTGIVDADNALPIVHAARHGKHDAIELMLENMLLQIIMIHGGKRCQSTVFLKKV